MEPMSEMEDLRNIFVSYSWQPDADKDAVQRLANRLTDHFNIWIDINEMAGRTDEAMKEGIECADLVLIFLNELYCGRPNCLLEARHALIKEKAIQTVSLRKLRDEHFQGEVGAQLKPRLYVEYFEHAEDHLDEAVVKICSTLRTYWRKIAPAVRQQRKLRLYDIREQLRHWPSNFFNPRPNFNQRLVEKLRLEPIDKVLLITGEQRVGKRALMLHFLNQPEQQASLLEMGFRTAMWFSCGGRLPVSYEAAKTGIKTKVIDAARSICLRADSLQTIADRLKPLFIFYDLLCADQLRAIKELFCDNNILTIVICSSHHFQRISINTYCDWRDFVGEYLEIEKSDLSGHYAAANSTLSPSATDDPETMPELQASLLPIKVPPLLPNYIPRRNDEMKVRLGIQKVAQEDNAKKGVFFIIGGGGIGKSTLAIKVIHDDNNLDFFLRECNIQVVIWKNCYKWRVGIEDGDQSFVQSLIDLGKTGVQDIRTPLNWRSLRQMIEHYKCRRRRILFVLDDVFHPSILQIFRTECDTAMCLAITRYPEQYLHFRFSVDGRDGTENPYLLTALSDDQIARILQMSMNNLADRLQRSQLDQLIINCCGSPLVASLIAGQFEVISIYGGTVDQLMRMSKEISDAVVPHQQVGREEETAKALFQTSLSQIRDEKLKKHFYTFLLFNPVEPVKLADLAFLCRLEVDEAIFTARRLEKLSLISRSGGAEEEFLVHHVLHDAAAERAHELYRTNSTNISILRLRLMMSIGGSFIDVDQANDLTKLHAFIYGTIRERKELLSMILPNFHDRDLKRLIDSEETTLEWQSNDDVATALEMVAGLGLKSWFQLLDKENSRWRGRNALLVAAKKGQLEVTKFICQKWPDVINLRDSENDDTALMTAAFKGHVKVVEWLLENEAVRNESNYNRYVTMIRAAEGGSLEMVQLLNRIWPEAGRQKDNIGRTALMQAAEMGHLKVVTFLANEFRDTIGLADDSGNTALSKAAENGRLDVVDFLAREWQEGVTLLDRSSETALMKAAGNGHVNVVRSLDTTCQEARWWRDRHGNTAMIRAASNGRFNVVAYLANLADDTTPLSDYQQETILMKAAKAGHLQIVEFLSEKWPRLVTMTDWHGNTALAKAELNGHMQVAAYLRGKMGE